MNNVFFIAFSSKYGHMPTWGNEMQKVKYLLEATVTGLGFLWKSLQSFLHKTDIISVLTEVGCAAFNNKTNVKYAGFKAWQCFHPKRWPHTLKAVMAECSLWFQGAPVSTFYQPTFAPTIAPLYSILPNGLTFKSPLAILFKDGPSLATLPSLVHGVAHQ